jgi:hypothetical protein
MPKLDTDLYVEALMSDDYCRCDYVTFSDIGFDGYGREAHLRGARHCNKPILREMNFWITERIIEKPASQRASD